jgi:hypothetical protein
MVLSTCGRQYRRPHLAKVTIMTETTKTEAPKSPALIVRLPKDYKAPRASSARGAWLAMLQKYNGKTLAEFTAACEKNPPSVPAKGKLAGKLEPVSGWVGYFQREKVLTLKE